MKKLLIAILGTLAVVITSLLVSLSARPAAAATLSPVTGFGTNPTNLGLYVYVPDKLATHPALLVAVHYCTGSAQAFFNGGAHDYVTAADRYGYIIIFPEATRDGHCFDVSTPKALTRNGGSDSTGIAAMVTHVQQTYHTDPARTYVTGASSGAMMANVLAAEYPDVFAAGTAFSGVPATCFSTGSNSSLWNSNCSGGKVIKTAREWADAARAMYPGYTGTYPRMQLWHGEKDTVLGYPEYAEEIKQWTALHGLNQTPSSTDHPQSAWTRTRYGSTGAQAPVEGISISGVGHGLPQSGQIQYSIEFLGLNRNSSSSATTPATTTPTATTPATTTPTATTPATTTPTATTPTSGVDPAPVTTPTPTSSDPTGIPASSAPATTPTSPTASEPPATSACTASYSVLVQWPGGFLGNVVVRNDTDSASTAWHVNFTFADGQTVTQSWNATLTQNETTITASNASYNGTLSPGSAAAFGFLASWNNTSNTAPTLTCSTS